MRASVAELKEPLLVISLIKIFSSPAALSHLAPEFGRGDRVGAATVSPLSIHPNPITCFLRSCRLRNRRSFTCTCKTWMALHATIAQLSQGRLYDQEPNTDPRTIPNSSNDRRLWTGLNSRWSVADAA